MANFFARVELHGAEWPDDDESLHTALQAHGFSSCITFENGEKQRLPTGFYFSTNRVDDVSRVAEAVTECADDTSFKNEVSVVKSAGSQHYLSKSC